MESAKQPTTVAELMELLKERATRRGLLPRSREWNSYVFGTAARQGKRLVAERRKMDAQSTAQRRRD